MGDIAGIITLIASAASSGYQAHESHEAKEQAKEISRFNVRVARQEAKDIRRQTQMRLKRAAGEGERIMGTLQARLGMSGARLDVGAPLEILAEQEKELDIDALLIAYEGERMAQRYEKQATVTMMGGRLQEREYGAQSTAATLRGTATLLGGTSRQQREGEGGYGLG